MQNLKHNVAGITRFIVGKHIPEENHLKFCGIFAMQKGGYRMIRLFVPPAMDFFIIEPRARDVLWRFWTP